MNSIRACFLVSYGMLFIYLTYLLVSLTPGYKMSKKEETIVAYLGIFIVCLTIVFFILYLILTL